jgi:hypothetical protein
MLAPRFSIRTLLVMISGGAVVFLVAGMAVRGQLWAWGVTIAALSVAVAAVAHGAWFGLVWLFAQLPTQHRADRAPASEPKSSSPNQDS